MVTFKWAKNKNVPFFLRYFKETLLLGIVSILISYFFFDIPLAKYYAHLSERTFCIASWLNDVIDPKYEIWGWILLYFIVRFFAQKEKIGNRLLLIILSITMANVTVSILKLFFARIEPGLLLSQNMYGFTFFSYQHPFLSFPSGHACTIGAIFGVLACYRPRYSLLFFLLSLALAFVRVVLEGHFFGDVIGGVLIGFYVSGEVYLLMKKRGFLI